MAENNCSLIGVDVDGRFTITHKIGSGGMGAVYSAVQKSIGREVAIKVIHPEFANDKATARRFLREAWLASRLQSQHVVSIHDFGQTDDGLIYMVMELVDGRTVSSELRRIKRFEPLRAVQIAMKICAALETAHRSGVVHRDLKPANIMLCSNDGHDEVTVLDFGLAKSLRSQAEVNQITEAGILVGTCGYIPPELVRGDAAAPTSDLYSLGAVLYTMLAGRKPFVGDELEVLRSHVLAPPPRLPDSVPAALADVVYRMLAKSPRDRYASARAAREALAVALSKPTLPAGPPPLKAIESTETIEPQTIELDTDDLSIEVSPPPLRAAPRTRMVGLVLAFLLLTVAIVATGVGLSANGGEIEAAASKLVD